MKTFSNLYTFSANFDDFDIFRLQKSWSRKLKLGVGMQVINSILSAKFQLIIYKRSNNYYIFKYQFLLGHHPLRLKKKKKKIHVSKRFCWIFSEKKNLYFLHSSIFFHFFFFFCFSKYFFFLMYLLR